MIDPEDLQNRLMEQQDREIDAVEKLESELKDCPWCKSGGVEVYFMYQDCRCCVICHNCDARGPLCDNEKSAALNWNTRQ